MVNQDPLVGLFFFFIGPKSVFNALSRVLTTAFPCIKFEFRLVQYSQHYLECLKLRGQIPEVIIINRPCINLCQFIRNTLGPSPLVVHLFEQRLETTTDFRSHWSCPGFNLSARVFYNPLLGLEALANEIKKSYLNLFFYHHLFSNNWQELLQSKMYSYWPQIHEDLIHKFKIIHRLQH